ncbi:hypothetical protein DY000_02008281 [Brassica cretica]|uniref:Uncharacterized protein n=1 Tax=Brassica cretica TaxID=69181 RepID=A0ABQ7CCX8_BRACR|nr:hypothetical protein DY000_02008281 [Brassica cretica]
MAGNMKWVRYGLPEIASKGRRECMTNVVSSVPSARSLRSDRASARARSLCSDRAEGTLDRYVATELWLELGRYVATERNTRLVAA